VDKCSKCRHHSCYTLLASTPSYAITSLDSLDKRQRTKKPRNYHEFVQSHHIHGVMKVQLPCYTRPHNHMSKQHIYLTSLFWTCLGLGAIIQPLYGNDNSKCSKLSVILQTTASGAGISSIVLRCQDTWLWMPWRTLAAKKGSTDMHYIGNQRIASSAASSNAHLLISASESTRLKRKAGYCFWNHESIAFKAAQC
jgi:hypothetical protein